MLSSVLRLFSVVHAESKHLWRVSTQHSFQTPYFGFYFFLKRTKNSRTCLIAGIMKRCQTSLRVSVRHKVSFCTSV